MRGRGARLRTAAIALASLAAFAVAGCGGDAARVETHRQKADEALRDGRVQDALLELHNGYALAPDDANIALLIADLLALKGDVADARFYYGEAYRRDPALVSAAIKLADLQRATEPEEAKALVDEVLETSPESAWGYIGRTEQALFDQDTTAALDAIGRALELEPDLAPVYWHLARVHKARIREFALRDLTAPDTVFEQAIAALARFAELDPDRTWRAEAEHARVLAAWPEHLDEADAQVRRAVEAAARMQLPSEEFAALELAVEIARKGARYDLAEWALERRIALDPTLYDSWEDLANVYVATGRRRRPVYDRLVAAVPDRAQPHIRYSRMLFLGERYPSAARYLRRQLAGDVVPKPPLLAELARLQLLSGRREESFRTVSLLEAEHPDSREAVIMSSWRWLESGRPKRALALLDEHDWATSDLEALRVRADSEMRMGNAAAARAAIEKLMPLLREPDARTLRLYAQTLHDTRAWRPALSAFRSVSQRTRLRTDERVMMAACLYETGSRGLGRKVLEDLVDERPPPAIAVLELAKREGTRRPQQERLRAGYAAVLESNPLNRRILKSLARYEIAAGKPERAVAPIQAAIDLERERERPTGDVELLLVRIYAAQDKMQLARDTALHVLETQPDLPDALPTAVALYPTQEDASAGILALTKGRDRDDRSAALHALLGRLYFKINSQVLARWSYEQALGGGLELPILKNDLAYLLARQGIDLQRATLLARQAAQALPNEPGVGDTLGFVLLKAGQPDDAVVELRRALATAESRRMPSAEIQYHLGLALAKLGQSVEAEKALETALALDDDFPDAENARRQLALVRGES